MLKNSILLKQKMESGLEQLLELKELGLPVKPTLELERKKIGPKAKQHMGKLVSMFSETNPEEIISSIQKDGKYDFKIDNEKISLDKEDFIINFDSEEILQ